MTVPMFIVAFGIGSAAIALWADVRLTGSRPSDLPVAMIHVALAMLIARFLVPAGLHAVGSATTALAAIFVVGLPATVYCLLATFWIMRQVSETLNGARRGPGSGVGA